MINTREKVVLHPTAPKGPDSTNSLGRRACKQQKAEIEQCQKIKG